MKWTAAEIKEIIHELIKLLLIMSLTLSFMGIVGTILYGIMFVTQPMSGQAPNDKALFAILTPLAIFLPTVLNQIWQTLNKEAHVPLPPSLTQAYTPPEPPKPAPTVTTTTTVVRSEPSLDPISAAPPVTVGYGGKLAPPPAPQPEI